MQQLGKADCNKYLSWIDYLKNKYYSFDKNKQKIKVEM